VNTLKADTVVARVILGGTSACLADWRGQRFNCGGRSRPQAPSRPKIYLGARPLCTSPVLTPLAKEPPTLRLTTSTVRDSQVTGRQPVLSLAVNRTDPATPAAGLR
jgi:hypothetical protein